MQSTKRAASPVSFGVAVALVATMSFGASAFAEHCKPYRGPAGQVPPTGRMPTDPTPPGSHPKPHGGDPTPRVPVPDVTGARPSGAPTGGAARPGGTTGRPRRSSAEGFERWEFWWEYNKDALLALRDRMHEREAASGSSDFFLGSLDRANARRVTRPTERLVHASVVPELLKATEDEHYLIRDAAVLALGKIGAPGTMPAIAKRLRDDRREVRESAALALGLLRDAAAIPLLVSLMNDDAASHEITGRREILTRTRGFAAVGLGLSGDERAVAPLLAMVHSAAESRTDVPVCAAMALGILGSPAAVGDLARVLADGKSDEFLRAYAATSLGKIGDARAIAVLESALRDESLHVARSAVLALGLFEGGAAAKAIGALREVAGKGRDPQSRNWALLSLGRIGGAAAKKALLEAVENEQRSTQAFAALGLALLGMDSPDPRLAEGLRRAMGDVRDTSVKGAFAIALGLLRDTASEPALLDIVTSPGPVDLRGYAAVALGVMGARNATPEIERLAREANDPALRRSAATALGLLGDRNAVALLASLLRTADGEYTTSSTAVALGTIGDHTAIEPLLEAARAQGTLTPTTRAYATAALGLLGEPTGVPKMSLVSRDLNYRAQIDAVKTLLAML